MIAAYDATIQVDWLIGIGGYMEKKRLGFIGFYHAYDESINVFRSRVLKAYDAINKAYEIGPMVKYNHQSHLQKPT